ncbi:MAG: type II toxin-antitoxin system death-on-curing family toxin [Pirellulales bacterium]
MEPMFLELADVVAIHGEQIERYGGSLGVRDLGLLESELAMPTASFGGEFLHRDLYEMAAAYLFHLVKNHPFLDGNKRVGAMAAYAFLDLNGIGLVADPDEFAELVLNVATGQADKVAIAEFLRANSRPLGEPNGG